MPYVFHAPNQKLIWHTLKHGNESSECEENPVLWNKVINGNSRNVVPTNIVKVLEIARDTMPHAFLTQ